MSVYAVCVDCGIEIGSEQDSIAHREETLASATPDEHDSKHSHAIRNMRSRASTPLENALESALYDFMSTLERSQEDDDLDEGEIRQALNRIDLESEWEAYTT